MNPNYFEESIKFFGLNNRYLSRPDETCEPYHQWAQSVTAEERNQPIALCVKETLLAINKLSGNLYGDVKEAKTFMPFLESIKASLAMLPGLESGIHQVINKK